MHKLEVYQSLWGMEQRHPIKKEPSDEHNFKKIKVAIVGDIKHSRVARSLVEGLSIMNTGQITLIAPDQFKPDMKHYLGVDYTNNLSIGLHKADAVIALRVQKERIKETNVDIESEDYFKAYGLTNEKIAECNKNVIVMHPGPMNRGIEIDTNLADDINRSVIKEQVELGVAVRMACLKIFCT